MCQKLAAFHDENGHLLVPTSGATAELAQWLNRQRLFDLFLSLEQKILLHNIHCDWAVLPGKHVADTIGVRRWDAMFHDSKHHHQKLHGPSKRKANKSMELENSKRRVPQQHEGLCKGTEESIRRQSDPHKIGSNKSKAQPIRTSRRTPTRRSRKTLCTWHSMYEQLVQYKAEKNECNVPRKFVGNPSLGEWVAHQRLLGRDGALSQKQVQALDALGFFW